MDDGTTIAPVATTTVVKKCKKCELEKPVSAFSRHSDTRDKLDQRCKACVRLVKQNKDRVLKPRELDILPTDATSGEWQGGKKKGTIVRKGDGLFIASVANKKSKSFRLCDYDMDEGRLREAANGFLYEKSLELGLTSNRYKIIFDEKTDDGHPTPQYLIVQLSKNFVMLCDYDQLDFVKGHHLCVSASGGKNEHKSHYAMYMKQDGKLSSVHKGITGFEMTDYIDRYPLDNRFQNLRPTNATENNRNRTNYFEAREKEVKTRLNFDVEREIWNASVELDGKIERSTFSVETFGYSEGKVHAQKWVKNIIKKLSTHPMTGVVLDETNQVFRSRIRVRDKQLERRFSITKLGHETAREMAIAWRTDMATVTDNHVSRPDETPVHSHPDYQRLRSEFEDIMVAHADGYKWKC